MYFECPNLMERSMRKYLRWADNAGWVLAFIALCGFWADQVVRASRHRPPPAMTQLGKKGSNLTGTGWICPIAGNCGPPGTPNIGRW
jgi:hypothetical protein